MVLFFVMFTSGAKKPVLRRLINQKRVDVMAEQVKKTLCNIDQRLILMVRG